MVRNNEVHKAEGIEPTKDDDEQALLLLIIATSGDAIPLGLLDLGCVCSFRSGLAAREVDGLIFILLALWLLAILILFFNLRLLLFFLTVLLGRRIGGL